MPPIVPWVSYRWNYLCSNPRRLAITLKALPRHRPYQGLLGMNICWASHLDPAHRAAELHVVADEHAPSWLNFWVYDLSQLKSYLPRQLERYWANDKARWALGMKLLMPYVSEGEPYLYTDDDVLVTRDPQAWLTNSFGSKGCFRFVGRKQELASELFDAFSIPTREGVFDVGGLSETLLPAWKQYDNAALDAGVWFQKYPDDWTTRLYRFANMHYLKDIGLRNLEFRCLDQRFLTCFGIKHGWDVRTIGNGFAPVSKITPKLLERHPFFHYKSQSKEKWMRLFEDYYAANQA